MLLFVLWLQQQQPLTLRSVFALVRHVCNYRHFLKAETPISKSRRSTTGAVARTDLRLLLRGKESLSDDGDGERACRKDK